jgi:hypothetical protein
MSEKNDRPASGGPSGIKRRAFLQMAPAAGLAAAGPLTGTARAGKKTSGPGYRFDHNGWVYIHIQGKPYERGFQHGLLAAPELGRIFRSLEYLTYFNTGKKWAFFADAAKTLWAKKIDPEFLDEIKGIAAGARQAGLKVGWTDILAWNGQEELLDYWWPNVMTKYRYLPRVGAPRDHCSGFLAAGKATQGGRIVMAHNTWDNFETGQFSNLILDVAPDKGHRIFMQSVPGYIDSMADFFVTGAGIMGTETTIGGFSLYDPDEKPEFFRVRKAMQYADDLDQFVKIMKKSNNGGYANSWLLASIKTGEIIRFELGLKFYNVERKKDGWFIGFNAPIDPRIRNLECSDTGFADIRRHQGARQVRLTQLMRQYEGRIDVQIGQKILADHHDVYLNKTNPCSRTVDGHYELDPRQFMSDPSRPLPYQPRGAVDGKVMDSALAKKMSFWGRWGNSSGMPFEADKFLARHIQWEHLKGFLYDRPSQPWTLFRVGQKH